MLFDMGSVLAKSVCWDFGIQWGLFAVAAALQTEKFYDLAGSGTFALLAWKSLQWGNSYFFRQKVQTGMVLTWAARLGLFLFTRIMGDGKDVRFDKVRGNPKLFFIYWTVQGFWVLLTMLPTLILNSKKRDEPVGPTDYVGWGLWITGFLCEVLADHQKSVFKGNPDNAGKFISTGLWSISRHPNYFGEILSWLGLYLSASSSLRGLEHLSVVSPMFVAYLLTRVSGIPLLEKIGQKRWGQDALYQAYVKNTAVLVPFIW